MQRVNGYAVAPVDQYLHVEYFPDHFYLPADSASTLFALSADDTSGGAAHD